MEMMQAYLLGFGKVVAMMDGANRDLTYSVMVQCLVLTNCKRTVSPSEAFSLESERGITILIVSDRKLLSFAARTK